LFWRIVSAKSFPVNLRITWSVARPDRLTRRWILIGSSEQKNREVSVGVLDAAASSARNFFGWAEEIHRRGLV